MGYLASNSAFIVVDADTGRIVSDKAYTSYGWAKRNINAGAYAKNREILELKPEVILDILRKQREESE